VSEDELINARAALAKTYGFTPVPADTDSKLGMSRNVRAGVQPINGVRTRPDAGTCGWYVWAGEAAPSNDPDFFEPLHVAHVEKVCPAILPYLELPPGWRFLIAPGHVDVWFDPNVDLEALEPPN
jgi:hypothetical protein